MGDPTPPTIPPGELAVSVKWISESCVITFISDKSAVDTVILDKWSSALLFPGDCLWGDLVTDLDGANGSLCIPSSQSSCIGITVVLIASLEEFELSCNIEDKLLNNFPPPFGLTKEFVVEEEDIIVDDSRLYVIGHAL